MNQKKHHKTIVLSDIHLGSKWSKAKEATKYLKENTCDTLILCGDIIDGWQLMRGKKAKWKKRHSNFIKLLLDIQHDTKIIYLRGNHDDFLDRILPLQFQNIKIVKDYIHTSNGKRFYVIHGDVFDMVTSRYSWLSKIGDVGYTLLMWVNKYYNNRRLKKGLPYYSLSREVKKRVKASVSYISDYEKHIVEIARKKKCDGVICGHIHHPEKAYYDEILYLNSGDWVESLSALTEDYDGNWEVVMYAQEEKVVEVMKEDKVPEKVKLAI
ncbi:UDP-2,3-diacylglucosamine diphosphatase [Dysgonomonas sp. GY75]|uniref:UDP-2,3-diacylglucosamine diphosphatase n=1 Tax=Dysgonomonas sp. GY75 TaxID=2780419 RepID=UPI0018831C6E|nr:UDP-2,3-diacylglucosamine diphosphatase [Dysgonomonas sp. GY75]MBF0649849.1 UDP-2,3-diacylglucosamine diphosphatase [Dysgonomonas sp. GY75]